MKNKRFYLGELLVQCLINHILQFFILNYTKTRPSLSFLLFGLPLNGINNLPVVTVRIEVFEVVLLPVQAIALLVVSLTEIARRE